MFDNVCNVILKFRCQRFGLDIAKCLGKCISGRYWSWYCVDIEIFVCGVGQFNSRDLREYSIIKCVFRKQRVKKKLVCECSCNTGVSRVQHFSAVTILKQKWCKNTTVQKWSIKDFYIVRNKYFKSMFFWTLNSSNETNFSYDNVRYVSWASN